MAGEYVKNLDQRVETLWQKVNKMGSGGGSGDGYTKAEADAKFQTIEGMSGYIPTSGNYFTVNGVRVYVSATQPVDAPTGSIWIGG